MRRIGWEAAINFFKLYIGDYQRDTAHLSITEHGAFMLMLQHYYATERPLPTGKALHRMLRAQDKAERDAIDAVAAQFWTATDAGLVNARADEEITKAAHQADTNARIAREREERRKAARKPDEPSTNRSTNDQPNHSHSQTPEEIQEPPTVVVGKASPPRPPDCPTDDLIRLYHERLPMLPRVEVLNDSRRRALSARWREVVTDPDIRKAADPKDAALDWFDWFFGHAAKSPFLTGRTKDWRADFDFLLTPSKFAKVVEGSYHKEHA